MNQNSDDSAAMEVVSCLVRLCLLSAVLGVSAVHAAVKPVEQGVAWDADSATAAGTKRSPRGAEIYRQTCIVCHEHGLNRAPAVYLLRMTSPQRIYDALTKGAMRQQGQSLSDADKRAVALFLSADHAESDSHLAPPACQGSAAQFDFQQPPAFPGWGMTLENTRNVQQGVGGIGLHNVGKLRLKWALGLDGATRVRSQPAIAGGALYLGTQNGEVIALDHNTGCLRWKFAAKSEVRTGIVVSPWRAGDTKARPLAYFSDFLGNVYAIDARSGALAWSDHVDAHPSTTLTGTPVWFRGRLYVPATTQEKAAVGSTLECCTSRGSMLAYDASSGKRLWKTFLVDEPTFQGVSSTGSKLYGPSGAGVWSAPAIDVSRGVMYFTTSNNYSSPASKTSDAVIAMDLATGQIRWTYQALANDAWNLGCSMAGGSICPKEKGVDFDFGAPAILVKSSKGKELVLAGQKSGWVYALDPARGTLVWKTKVGRGGKLAGIYFGMAVNRNAVFVPVADVPDGESREEPAKPGLYALDLDTGDFLWKSPIDPSVCKDRGTQCEPGIGAPVTVSNDLVLSGAYDGRLRFFSASDGRVVWDYDTTADIKTVGGGTTSGGSIGGSAGPVVYGKTVIVESGYDFAGRIPGNLLLVFEAP